MSFRMYMNTYGIFLSNAKKSLNLMQDNLKLQDENILNATNVIISCAASVEAFINKLFQEYTNFKCYDELKLSGKLETQYNLNSKNIDWGRNPYQTFIEIIGVRIG